MQIRSLRERRDRLGAAERNEVLTGLNAVVLVGLLATEGYTIVNIGGLVTARMFIALVLIPPLLLKLASIGCRFVRGAERREAVPGARFGGMATAAAVGGGAAMALALVLSLSAWHG